MANSTEESQFQDRSIQPDVVIGRCVDVELRPPLLDGSDPILRSAGGPPGAVRAALEICLASGKPVCVLWGSDTTCFYNDSFASIFRLECPGSMIGGIRGVWPKPWENHVRRFVELVALTGQIVRWENARLQFDPVSGDQDCRFAISFVPIGTDMGDVCGVFAELIGTDSLQMGSEAVRDQAVDPARDVSTDYGQISVAEAEALNGVVLGLTAELDLQKLVQKVTDAGTSLTAAKFGAFLYNTRQADGETYLLYALSGAPRESFEEFGIPRYTALFAPTFKGEHPVRIGDVLRDPRYGQNFPHHGMPQGHLSVRSYLAVPVVSSCGEVIGGLFFGHPEPHVFTDRAERLAQAVAAQAAVAIDNARLYEQAQREIAERKRAEAALRNSDQRLRVALEAGHMGTWEWALRTGCVTWSPSLEEMHGRPVGSFAGTIEDALTGVHPQDRDRLMAAVRKAVETGAPYHVEYRISIPQGQQRWLEARGSLIHDDQGQPDRLVGVCMDVTERNQINKALAESEELFRTLTANAPAAIFIKDLDGRYTFANPLASESVGRPEGLVGKTDHDILPTELADLLRQNDFEVMSTGRPIEREETVGHNGVASSFLSVKFPLRASDATIAGVCGVAVDITRRKAVEENLRESEQRYRSLVEGLPAAVYTCDAQGRLTLYNEAAAALWGRRPEIGKELWCGSYRIFRPSGEPLPLAECPLAIALRECRAVRGEEIVIERPDGMRRNILPYPEPLFNASGELIGAINMLMDITEHRLAEAELAAIKDDLALQVQALTRLHALAMQLAGTPELRPALQAVLETIVSIHRADFGLVSLFDAKSGQLCEAASVGFAAEPLEKLSHIEQGLEGGACGIAFETKTRVVIEDVESDHRSEYFRATARAAGFRSVQSTPILNRQGEALGVLSVHFKAPRLPTQQEMQLSDVCVRHAADAIETACSRHALRESEEYFRIMADTAPAMLWVTDRSGTCTFLSRGWYDFTGQSPETGLGFGWFDALHPEDRQATLDAFVAANVDEKPFRLEFRLRNSQGGYCWVIDAASPRFGPDGEFLGMIGSVIDITERKQAEAAMRESEERFRVMADTAPAMIWVTDPTGECKFLSRGWYEFTGQEEADGAAAWLDALHHDDRPAVQEAFVDALARKKPFAIDYRLRRADGYYRWVIGAGRPRLGPGGEFLGYIGSVIDIHDRKKAEAALYEANERLEEGVRARTAELVQANAKYKAMYDQGLFAGLLSLDGKMIDANRSSLEAGGFAREEVIGKLYWETGWWNRSAGVQTWLKEGFTRAVLGQPFHGETVYFAADGSERIVDFAFIPIKDDEGNVLFVVPTGLDITDRRRGEQERKSAEVLRESEARFRQIADHAPVLMWIKDEQGFQFVNSEYLQFLGCTQDEIRGIHWQDQLHPSDVEAYVARYRRAFAQRKTFKAQARFRRVDGQFRWMRSIGVPRLNADGTFFGYVGCSVDITEIKHSEQILKEAKEAAEAANRSKDRFLAVLSHELRTPLTPVLMAVAAMEADASLPAQVREDLTMIHRNVELETKLIDDLLDLSRITTGKLQLQFEPVDLNAAVRHVCEICRSQIQEKAIRLHVSLDENVGCVLADPARLQQVLWNVLKNAAKFTHEAGDIYVTTSVTPDRKARAEVRDTGIGIAPGKLSRIFDAFEQGDPGITKQFGGLGLGLAISKAVMELHNGSIIAQSRGAGRGSVFAVELPVHVPVVRKRPARLDGDGHERPTRLRLLIVEDHVDTARILSRMLQASGYVTETAHTVTEALELFAAHEFDILVSDVGLPDGTGYDLMRRVSKLHAIKGIAMSGYGMDEDIQRGREAGFCDHLVKPVDVAQLKQAIRRAAGVEG